MRSIYTDDHFFVCTIIRYQKCSSAIFLSFFVCLQSMQRTIGESELFTTGTHHLAQWSHQSLRDFEVSPPTVKRSTRLFASSSQKIMLQLNTEGEKTGSTGRPFFWPLTIQLILSRISIFVLERHLCGQMIGDTSWINCKKRQKFSKTNKSKILDSSTSLI